MNIIVLINGADVSQSVLMSATKINFDMTRRITTAEITVMGQAFSNIAKYDYAHYDTATYALDLSDLYEVVIIDGRDGVTKLFDGQIATIDMVQSDAPTFEVFFHCTMNDRAIWLDRAVCWDSTFHGLTFPASDKQVITTLLGHFCPQITLGTITQVVPVIQSYQWLSKTCRQVLDDMSALAMTEWHVDVNGVLNYDLAANAPAAPYDLSTSPDYMTSFPVKVTGYKRDFSNPVNASYVRGGVDPGTGAFVQANYSDQTSITQYGVMSQAIVDTQITTAWDASLRAKSTVLQYAYPIETGSFTVWGTDWLKCGMAVDITEDALGLDGTYIVRALSMNWEEPSLVRYEAQFGAAQPDLETVFRLINARTLWSSTTANVGTPAPGSVSDSSIVPGGLSAAVINSVSAQTIQGIIAAEHIGGVNANLIAGSITADQIDKVYSTDISGAITAGQIQSLAATQITGVIVSNQLVDGIIDTLSKYQQSLRPVPLINAPPYPTLPDPNYPANSYFYNNSNGTFYQVNAAGTGYSSTADPSNVLMNFYHIGAISAKNIVGVIVAAQIGSVNASAITGQINAANITQVNMSSLTGTLTSTNAARIDVGALSGLIQANQIGQINATTITIGQIQDGQIGTINGSKLIAGTVISSKIDTNGLDVGSGGSMAGVIRVWSGGTQVASIGAQTWFKIIGIGGTAYSNAPLVADSNGNVTLTITGGGSTITISPTTFDQTYSSVAVRNVGGSDSASFISRGVVLYSGGSSIGNFVRGPSGPAQLELTGGGSNYVLITGSGGVRADQGLQVGGVRCVNSQGQWVGAGVVCTGYGIAAAGFNPYVGGTQYNGVAGLTSFKSGDSPQKTVYVAGGCVVNIV